MHMLMLISMILCWLLSFFIMMTYLSCIFSWEESLFSKMKLLLKTDTFSNTFFVSLLLIFYSIILYSFFYLKNEKDLSYFFTLMTVFVSSMIMLLFFYSFPVVLLGWEGLGASSYLLILFYSSSYALNSANVTLLINRFGDAFIFLAVSLVIFFNFHFFSALFYIFLLVACFSKSAQIPLSIWLPEAMAAPTPVSALVHSSTLVSAGSYLLIRFFPVSFKIFIFCLLTSILGALAALGEKDLKKIIALSTLSQLGFMLLPLFVGSGQMAATHLLLHAFFKALLFLSVGIFLILNFSQSYPKNFILAYPLNSAIMKICLFSMAGLSFMSAFFSKDQMLLLFSISPLVVSMLFLLFISCFFTFSYSFLLMKKVFFVKTPASSKMELSKDISTLTPLLMLIFYSPFLVTVLVSESNFNSNYGTFFMINSIFLLLTLLFSMKVNLGSQPITMLYEAWLFIKKNFFKVSLSLTSLETNFLSLPPQFFLKKKYFLYPKTDLTIFLLWHSW